MWRGDQPVFHDSMFAPHMPSALSKDTPFKAPGLRPKPSKVFARHNFAVQVLPTSGSLSASHSTPIILFSSAYLALLPYPACLATPEATAFEAYLVLPNLNLPVHFNAHPTSPTHILPLQDRFLTSWTRTILRNPSIAPRTSDATARINFTRSTYRFLDSTSESP
ncbi:hypothetical protein CSUB01_07009 [Colletotrichum sublineola]|uniref:Uncharacterized protein n=1 Tax=Colletotrichum sublineola TaxID=1173701 RepID=A0A066XAB0_COLSU|nr:hypothetical protein CSUB01_07009 [Colletotrichum sublineola]